MSSQPSTSNSQNQSCTQQQSPMKLADYFKDEPPLTFWPHLSATNNVEYYLPNSIIDSDYATAYLNLVQEKLKDQPQMFRKFLCLLSSYNKTRKNLPYIIAQTIDLLKDYPELIIGFNTFLPENFKMKVELTNQ